MHIWKAIFDCFTVNQVLGGEGRGVYVLMSGLDLERGLGASGPLGWAKFTFTLSYTHMYSLTI